MWATSDPTFCTLPAIRFRNTCDPWIAIRRSQPRRSSSLGKQPSFAQACYWILCGRFFALTCSGLDFWTEQKVSIIAYMAGFYNFVKYSKARHMSPGRKP